MIQLQVGRPVTWQAWSAEQRAALRKHKEWVIAKAEPLYHLAGEISVLLAPKDHMHEARWVRMEFIHLVPTLPPAVQQAA